jgi:tetratricopeptide (TPR) repeat protein
MAVRNVALLAPVCGPLAAWHGGSFLRRLSAERPRAARFVAPAAAWLSVVAALGLAGGFATEYYYRARGSEARFGLGMCPDHYLTGLAQWLGESNAPGCVFATDFGNASAFLYYGAASQPPRQVWMDGRLEIKSLRRFRQYQELAKELATPSGAERVAIPASVRFLAVANLDPDRLASLSQCGRFRLIRLDRVGALFARLDWQDPRPPREVAAELPAQPNLADFDKPLTPDGSVEGFGAEPRRWYRQNPQSAAYHFADMMLALGGAPLDDRGRPMPTVLQLQCSRLAVRYFSSAAAEGTPPPALAAGALAQALRQWAAQTQPESSYDPSAERATPPVPIDVDLARSLCLYSRMDLAALSEKAQWTLGMSRIQTLLQGGHLDAAAEDAEAFPSLLPPRQQVFLSGDFVAMRDKLRSRVALVRAGLVGVELRSLSPIERAKAITTPQRGLTLAAVRELEAVPTPDAATRMALGDYLLRLGRPAQARPRYRAAESSGAPSADVALRLALCDWVEGNLPGALERLEGRTEPPDRAAPSAAAGALDTPLALFYRALLLEELGHYPRAKESLRAASDGADPELAKLIAKAKARL